MSGLPWMLVRLALETDIHHSSADQDRLVAMDIKSRRDYGAFLSRIYGFEAPVERAICGVKGLAAEVMVDRQRAPRLRQDLRALGLSDSDIAALPVARCIQIDSPARALGWLFVLERHTLVAGLIQRHLYRALGVAASGAFSYLSAYGERAGARIRALGEIIGSHVEGGSTPSSIVAAANEGFRAQGHWYRAMRSVSAPRTASPTEKPPQVNAATDCDDVRPAHAIGGIATT